jgi:hypothetical protein
MMTAKGQSRREYGKRRIKHRTGQHEGAINETRTSGKAASDPSFVLRGAEYMKCTRTRAIGREI